MRPRQPKLAASFARRPKRRTPSARRPESKGSQNAQRSYERYLALARAEALSGDMIGAENYYQHAETLFQIDVPGARNDIGDFAAATAFGLEPST